MASPLRSVPQDLAAAQLALHHTCRELIALYGHLPHYAVPAAAWVEPDGTTPPASPGWSEADHTAVEELLDRERTLRAAIGSHPWWTTPVLEEAPPAAARPVLGREALEQAA
ncbi:hypothetical protein QMK19_41070 [Streptomyces sp. H10-C2]|uniref:hypothetical protein n=1 Tax=unclassified Streptomyces TaxID=2593676 RepID=UPI0024BB5001|nr:MULTISPECIES: hypothetical protein [unclassified Streptomyces]MDJ0347607.1 hypothetical protein [Streptomyces sp. PH10-H1]MDJ0375791.1 hypothetical protein [Streptomyces sp. H10-C2]